MCVLCYMHVKRSCFLEWRGWGDGDGKEAWGDWGGGEEMGMGRQGVARWRQGGGKGWLVDV